MQQKVAAVTVVIPCYRCTGSILRAVDSVLQQSLMPAEIVLVDDASGDDTLKILHNLEFTYPHLIKVIALVANAGAACARNAGWEKATQPYIAFLDADDSWHPRKIEIQYIYMIKHPEVYLCGHAHHFLSSDKSDLNYGLEDWVVEDISKNALLVSNKFITPSVMIKSDIKHRFISGQRFMEDHMLWLNIIFSGQKVVKLSARLAIIYKNSFGTSGLSSKIWEMEKSELGNYWWLFKNNKIGFISILMLSLYSLAKYLRRLLIVSLRKIDFAKN